MNALSQLPSSSIAHLESLCQILNTGKDPAPLPFAEHGIECHSVNVHMRDGIRLATDIYSPPLAKGPTVVIRTPYSRGLFATSSIHLARYGYFVVVQDCRGTGDSEPHEWEYFIFEPEDSVDLVDWILSQDWCDGFIAGCGGSYLAATQWCMAVHDGISAIAPEVGGLGVLFNDARFYMFLNAFVRTVGNGADMATVPLPELERQMLPETLAGGYFNDPLERPLPEELLEQHPEWAGLPAIDARRLLWRHCVTLPPAERLKLLKTALEVDQFTYVEMETLYSSFGRGIAFGAHTLPRAEPAQMCRDLRAPALMITGWYDWGLNDTLESWNQIQAHAPSDVATRSRLLITPSAHNVPGYHEDMAGHPELERHHRFNIPLLAKWYEQISHARAQDWPAVIYYMMGANEWRGSAHWPPEDSVQCSLYFNDSASLTWEPPELESEPDRFTYDPEDPTPTVGGSVLSYVYPPGSCDVSAVQHRPDVLTYTTVELEHDLDVVGPLRVVLFASSSAPETDFCARVSDIFPDGRAIQLQTGIVRTRYDQGSESRLLTPGQPYRFEIEVWATANRFRAGHRLRVDISSADFPRFDRNCNRAGEVGDPLLARQAIYRTPLMPSHLQLHIMPRVEGR